MTEGVSVKSSFRSASQTRLLSGRNSSRSHQSAPDCAFRVWLTRPSVSHENRIPIDRYEFSKKFELAKISSSCQRNVSQTRPVATFHDANEREGESERKDVVKSPRNHNAAQGGSLSTVLCFDEDLCREIPARDFRHAVNTRDFFSRLPQLSLAHDGCGGSGGHGGVHVHVYTEGPRTTA